MNQTRKLGNTDIDGEVARKKIISLLLSGLIIISLSACGGNNASPENGNSEIVAGSTEDEETDTQVAENIQHGAADITKQNDDEQPESTEKDWLSDLIPLTGGEGGSAMAEYDFSVFTNVELIGADLSAMNDEQLEVLLRQAKYCQAMTDADTDTLRELVSEDAVFTHMSGRQQTREEYFADIEKGSLRYFTIGIDNPVIEVDGEFARITFTSVLNANAYGARGTYRMNGTHWFEKQDGNWISINDPNR